MEPLYDTMDVVKHDSVEIKEFDRTIDIYIYIEILKQMGYIDQSKSEEK